MNKWLASLCVFIMLVPSSQALAGNIPIGISTTVFNQILPMAKRVVAGHSMSPKGECSTTSVPGYEGLPTQLCNYIDHGRHARVILLDADATRLTGWVIFICQGFDSTTTKTASERFIIRCSSKLLSQISNASHGHFPVAGVVYKNRKAYVFRDGIEVTVPGIKNGETRQLTEQELDAAISAPYTQWGYEAYPQGTTYADYFKFGRLTDASSKLIDDSALKFPQLIATRYRDDWNTKFNTLLRAWACAHIDALKSKMSCVELPPNTPGAAQNSFPNSK